MRRALIALLLLTLLPIESRAQIGGMTTIAQYVQYSKVPKNRRVAMIDYTESDGDPVQVRGINFVVGLLADRLKDTGGIEVYRFPSTYFYQKRTVPEFNGSAQWQRMGDYFGCVLVVSMLNRFNPSTDAGKKFFCAESTSAQLVQFGGGGQVEWRESQTPASYVGVGISPGENNQTAGVFETESGKDGPRVYCTTYYGNKDTLAAQSIPYHTAPTSTQPGFIVSGATDSTATDVFRVVRLLKPSFFMAQNTRPSWSGGTVDSVSYEQWYSDSIVHGGEVMPWAWRTYWKQRGFAAVDSPFVDYVMIAPPINHRNCMAHIAWAVMARYLDIRPVKVALEWDDVGNQGFNPSTTGSAWGSGNPRFLSNRILSGYVTEVMKLGWKPLICGEPDTLKFYAFTGKDSAVAGDGYFKQDWMKSTTLAFVNHVHDTIQTRIFSNPVGRGTMSGFGGNNAAHHMQAHAYSPSQWPWFGIYNKLAAMDSVTRSWHTETPATPYFVSPYLSFANDNYLPQDWRINAGTADPQTGRCPPESLFQALVDAGKFYVRGYVADQDTAGNAGVQTSAQVGSRYFTYPGEKFQCGNQKVTNVGTMNWVGLGGMYAEARRLSADAMCKFMGLTNDEPRLWVVAYADPTHETAETHLWTLLLRRNIGCVDRVRVYYTHPKNYDDQNQTQCEGYTLLFTLRSFRALNQLAGNKPVVLGTYPWETYDWRTTTYTSAAP